MRYDLRVHKIFMLFPIFREMVLRQELMQKKIDSLEAKFYDLAVKSLKWKDNDIVLSEEE